MENVFSQDITRILTDLDKLIQRIDTLFIVTKVNIGKSDFTSIKNEHKELKKNFKKNIKQLEKSIIVEEEDKKNLFIYEKKYQFYLKSEKYYALLKNDLKQISNKEKAEKFFKKKIKYADLIQTKIKTKTDFNKNFQNFDIVKKEFSSEMLEIEILFSIIDDKLVEMKHYFFKKFKEEQKGEEIEQTFDKLKEKINKISIFTDSLMTKEKLFELLEQKRQHHRLFYCFFSKNNELFEKIYSDLCDIYISFDKDFIPESINKIKNLVNQIIFSSIDIDDIINDRKIINLIEEEYNDIILTFEKLKKQIPEFKNDNKKMEEFYKNSENMNFLIIFVSRIVNLKKKFIMEFFLENGNYEILFLNFMHTKNQFSERKDRLLFFFHPDKNKFEYLNDEEIYEMEKLVYDFFSQINEFVQFKSKEIELLNDIKIADRLLKEAQDINEIKLLKQKAEYQNYENNFKYNDFLYKNKTILELEKIIKDKTEKVYNVYEDHLDSCLYYYLKNNKDEKQRREIIVILNKITNCLIIQGEKTLATIYNLFALKQNSHPYTIFEDLSKESIFFWKSLNVFKNQKTNKFNFKDNDINNVNYETSSYSLCSSKVFIQEQIYNRIKCLFFEDLFNDSKDSIDMYKIKRQEKHLENLPNNIFLKVMDGKKYIGQGGSILAFSYYVGTPFMFAGGILGSVYLSFGLVYLGVAIKYCAEYFKSEKILELRNISEKINNKINLFNCKVSIFLKIFFFLNFSFQRINKALEFYEEGKENEFIEEMSKEFNRDEKMIDLEQIRRGEFDCEIFSKFLLKYMIKPLTIKILLNCIADVFLRHKIETFDISINMNFEGKKILQWLINKEKNILYLECEKLDKELDEIHSLRKSWKEFFKEMIYKGKWKKITTISISDDDKYNLLQEFNKSNYKNLYDDSIIITQINLAIENILSNDYLEAKKLIQNIMDNNKTLIYHFPLIKKKVNILKIFYKLYLNRNLYTTSEVAQIEYQDNFEIFDENKENNNFNYNYHNNVNLKELENFLKKTKDITVRSAIHSKISDFYEVKFDKTPI